MTQLNPYNYDWDQQAHEVENRLTTEDWALIGPYDGESTMHYWRFEVPTLSVSFEHPLLHYKNLMALGSRGQILPFSARWLSANKREAKVDEDLAAIRFFSRSALICFHPCESTKALLLEPLFESHHDLIATYGWNETDYKVKHAFSLNCTTIAPSAGFLIYYDTTRTVADVFPLNQMREMLESLDNPVLVEQLQGLDWNFLKWLAELPLKQLIELVGTGKTYHTVTKHTYRYEGQPEINWVFALACGYPLPYLLENLKALGL